MASIAMTAREKFMARLKELGLYDEWATCEERVGKVMDDGTIVILIHYEGDKDDPYNEIHYPSFEELWENENFRNECKEEFYCHEDDHFVAKLAYWLDIHKNGAECPLFPVDVYFTASGLETETIEFEDDENENENLEILTDLAKRLYKTDNVTVTVTMA